MYKYKTFLICYSTIEKREDITIQEEHFGTITISYEKGKKRDIPYLIEKELKEEHGKGVEFVIKSCCKV